ncbi:MAG: CesT family type III secretion system chaperone [Candidatus Competibacter sp.]
MHFNEAMRQLAERLGLEELRPDASGEYALFFDDTLEVRCASMGKSLRLRGSIGKRSASSPEAEGQMKTLLRHSLARMKDRPEIVSLDAATGEFILHRVLALEQLRIESLEQALGDYLNRLEYWRDLFDGTATARRGPALTLLFP